MRTFCTLPLERTREFRGIQLPAQVRLDQLVVTGPRGAGKSTLIRRLGGWPEEGYVDLTMRQWWRAPALLNRPRELHLGVPVKRSDGILAHQNTFHHGVEPVEVDFDRILLPPLPRFSFLRDMRKRLVFEFLIPEPRRLFEQRLAQAKDVPFPVHQWFSMESVQRQAILFWELAAYFHGQGLTVYTRADVDSVPRRFAGAWMAPEGESSMVGAPDLARIA